jgi:hypothetical protein
MDFASGFKEKEVACPQKDTHTTQIDAKNSGDSGPTVSTTSQTSHSSDENPQSPETLDSSTPTIDFTSLNL